MRRLILHNVAVIWASSPRLLPKTEFSDTLLVEGKIRRRLPRRYRRMVAAKFRVVTTNKPENSRLDNNWRSTGGWKGGLIVVIKMLLKGTQRVKTMEVSGAGCSGRNREMVQGNLLVNHQLIFREVAGRVTSLFAPCSRPAMICFFVCFLVAVFPRGLSAQTPSVGEILSRAKQALDDVKTYDAIFDVYHPLSTKSQTNGYREVWFKSDKGIKFYRFQSLNPPNDIHTVPYLQIRNSSGTWEILTNGISKRAFDLKYEQRFQPDFQIPTNREYFANVAEEKVDGVSCFVITAKEIPGLSVPSKTSYYVSKTNYLVHAEITMDSSGNTFKKSIIKSLRINERLDDSLFTLPPGLNIIPVTNQAQLFAYKLETVKAIDQAKGYIKLPGGAADRGIPIRGLVWAGLVLSTFAAAAFAYMMHKPKK